MPLPEQERIALDFIRANRDGLRALGQFPGIETFILMFHDETVLEDDTVGVCVGPSKLLMWHALDVGVRLDYTVIVRRPSDL